MNMSEKGPSILSYVGAIGSVLSSLTLTDVGIIVGILTAIGTYLYNRNHTKNKEAREARQHELDEQIKLLQIQRLKGVACEAE